MASLSLSCQARVAASSAPCRKPRSGSRSQPTAVRTAQVHRPRHATRDVRGLAMNRPVVALAESTYDQLENIAVDLSGAPECQFFRVEAIIRPWRLQFVIDSLVNGGIKGMTITKAYGIGAQGGEVERYGGNEFQGNQVVEKTKLEVIAVREQVDFIVKKITVAAHTGENGDGKIFVHPVVDAIRIRTGETGANAEKMAGGRSDLLSTGSIDEGAV
mmetsp:Transcript_23755/g.61714  ORF Transcript_23755/g.61714 Transcript_23755/m.61714 type:complete len:216 (-) Transcript_23755:245-892(-)|eukprot:jgi/Tetstr1/432327/TSEL_021725.t1